MIKEAFLPQADINKNYHAAKFINFVFRPLKGFLEIAFIIIKWQIKFGSRFNVLHKI
jgi:hypothetical protein